MKETAPEKIHIQPNAHDRWFEGKIPNGLPNGLFVEYTRTDAFIEKARKWFEMQNEGVDSDGNYKCDMIDFEDFINYMMKGE